MSDKAETKNKQSHSHLSTIGKSGTIIYVAALVLGIPIAVYLDWITLGSVKLNELGDFLAGAFGPLAIFWLVIGFFQQSRELQNSVDALNLQAEELNNSVQQQREMVAVTRETLELDRQVLGMSESRRKKSLKPLLEIIVAPWVGLGKKFKFKGKITNGAAGIASFKLVISESNSPWLHAENSFFANGNTIETSETDYTHDPEGRIHATASFIDSDGEYHTQEYRFTCIRKSNGWPTYTSIPLSE